MSSETSSNNEMQVVSFFISENASKKGNYAISIDQVKEIKTVDSFTKIPRSKSYVKGVMNLRGSLIPIIDVKAKIGASNSNTSDSSKQRILITDVNETLTGLLVDEVNEVLRVNVKDVEPAPQGLFEINYIKGIAKIDEKLVILIDASEFLKDSNGDVMPIKSSNSDKESSNESTMDTDVVPEIEEMISQKITN